MSFRNRLALFLVVTLVAVQALTATFAYVYLRHNLVERGKHELAAAMDAFTRQLDFLSERVADGVDILSLDYALRAAIGQQDHDTELSALRNHGNRIGATRMLLIGLDGRISADTSAPGKNGETFAFASLLQTAAMNDKGTALATLGGRVYWIVVVPVRAPVPIAFIAAYIPVNDALLQKLRSVAAVSRSVTLASLGSDGRWIVNAQSGTRRHFALPVMAHPVKSEAEVTRENGGEYLTVTTPLKTADRSAPVVAIMDYPLDEALSAYRSLLVPMMLVFGFGLLAALAGAMAIVRGVSRPLEALAAAAKRIASGDYSPPPRLGTRDELGHLADALVNMAKSIAEREAALRAAVEAMELARNQAVQASEAKSQFLANMSHELRTPLNAILGFSEMIAHQVLGPLGIARYGEYAGDINKSGQHLKALVDRMLDLAEAESQRLAISRNPVDIGSVVKESVASLELFARQGSVRVTLREPEFWPSLDGDEAKLRQALTNLIHNAIKFTPKGGEVEISASARNERLAIRIADNGIGMDPEMLNSVVRPFHRLKHAFDGRHQGAGLGLPFAKVVIELHGGSLKLSSAEGVGTTVLIELPAASGALTNAA